MSEHTHDQDDFAQQASQGHRTSVAREFVDFLRDNKKWWLGPIVVVLLLLAAIAVVGGQAAAPFIYTLF